MNELFRELYAGWRRTLLVLTALLLLNLTLAVVLVFEQWPAEARKQAELASLTAMADTGHGPENVAWYQQGTKDLTRIRAMLPARRSFPDLLGELITAAADSRVTMGAVTYKPRRFTERRLLAYDVAVSITGSYFAVKSFLYDMQTSEGLLVIDGLRLANDDPYREQVTMDLRFTVYLRDGA